MGTSRLMGFVFAAMLATALAPAYAFADGAPAAESYGSTALAAGSSGIGAISVDAQSTKTDSYDGVKVKKRTAGTTSYDPKTKTLTLNKVKAESIVISKPGVKVVLVGKNVLSADEWNEGVLSVTAKEGSTTISGGGSIEASLACNNRLVIQSGTLKGNVSAKGDFLMKGGSLVHGGPTDDWYCELLVRGNFRLKGGKIKIPVNAVFGGANKRLFAITGGAISLNGAEVLTEVYVNLEGRNLTMKGGLLKVVAPNGGVPVYVESVKRNGKRYGGAVNVTGGSVTALADSGDSYAIEAESMSNEASFLKKIRGSLPSGATFKAGKSEYQVRHDSYYTNLKKYGDKKTVVRLCKEVRFGGASYRVDGVGSKAFDTKAGHKVKKITVDGGKGHGFQQLEFMGSKAFYNTKSLTRLELAFLCNHKAKNGELLKISLADDNKQYRDFMGGKMPKDVFKKCGKDGGKGLSIVLDTSRGIAPKDLDVYRSFLTKLGLSSEATIVANDSNDGYWL